MQYRDIYGERKHSFLVEMLPVLWKVIFLISSSLLVWTVIKCLHTDVKQVAKSRSNIVAERERKLIPGSKNASVSILDLITEIEYDLLFHNPSKPLAVAKDISFGRYYAQRDIQGWNLGYANMSFEFIEKSFRTQVQISDLSVFLCLGIQSQDKHCMRPSAFQGLRKNQKYNQIHGIRDILWRKDGFCYTMREALYGFKPEKPFTFPCWVLPRDRTALEATMNRGKSPFIVKPSGQGEGHGIFVVNNFDEILERREIQHNSMVVQPLLTDPYLVNEKKFDFRTYVLVTSVLPLRAYIYKEGLVRFASSKYNRSASRGGDERQYLTNTSIGKKYTNLANLTWTFEKLKSYFSSVGVNGEEVFESINDAIVRTLLLAEYRFQRDFTLNLGGYDCQSCFQLLGIDVILDSSLNPFVIEVNGLPSMQLSHDLGVPPDPTSPYTITKYGLMHDMLQILFKNTSVASELARFLEILHVGIKPGPLCNQNVHVFCVDFKEMQKLVDARREFVNRGGYQRIYPSSDGDKYSKLIQRMDILIDKKFMEVESAPRTLWRTHHLYTALEKLYIAHQTS